MMMSITAAVVKDKQPRCPVIPKLLCTHRPSNLPGPKYHSANQQPAEQLKSNWLIKHVDDNEGLEVAVIKRL